MAVLRLDERFPGVWAGLDRLAIIVLGGLLFWLFSILILTLPAALAALYAVTGTLYRPAPGEILIQFWHTFRRTFRTGAVLGLLQLVVGVVLYLDIRILWSVGALWARAAALGFGSLALLALMTSVFSYPLLAWYPQPVKPLLKRSFLLAASHPFWALTALLTGAGVLFGLTFLPGPTIALLPLAGPSLFTLVTGFFAWKVMKRYADPAEEMEAE